LTTHFVPPSSGRDSLERILSLPDVSLIPNRKPYPVLNNFEINTDIAEFIQPTMYTAARSVAESVKKHFLYHHSERSLSSEQLAPKPTAQIIEAIIDTTFWSSLRREEGRSPKISIAFLPPEMAGYPLIFEHRLVLSSKILTKLAPAVERSGIHLGVWHDGNELYVWGTTRIIPGLCFVLEVVEPGMLVIKHRRVEGFGKFVNVAVLKGDEIKIIDEGTARTPDCPKLVNSMLGFATPSLWNDSLNILVQMAVSVRNHGRGGILLVVPTGSESWRDSIIHPISHALSPSFSELAFLNSQKVSEMGHSAWQDKVSSAINNIAGLTAVDGATIINDQYEVLAFGAKIGRADNGSQVEEILLTEPVVGNVASVVHPVQNGGTRHLSAAQFVHDQHRAIALVASQDGRFTIFSWSQCERKVQAHRVDALLL
jgi:hypothetical protein